MVTYHHIRSIEPISWVWLYLSHQKNELYKEHQKYMNNYEKLTLLERISFFTKTYVQFI